MARAFGRIDTMVRIGTAGWNVPGKPSEAGSHLSHYAQSLPCAEINSSFYRPHRASTWARWAAETPADFRFSIKAPRTITHELKLRNAEPLLRAFFEQLAPIRPKAGPILFQLPPSLAFEPDPVAGFLHTLRAVYEGEAVFEPRHATWFTEEPDALLREHRVARAAVDPPKGAAEAAHPGGDPSLVYYRLHGSPRIYYSAYEDDFLRPIADSIRAHAHVWVIFDNTAHGHAFANAQRLRALVDDAANHH